jgi:hypothetical protein
MREAALDEASDIRAFQQALVNAGMRAAFWPPAIARAQALEACARLIDRIVGNKQILDLLKGEDQP